MAGPFDLTGQNIENTYQRILQTPDGTNFYDGTGSAVTFTATAVAGGQNSQIQFNSGSTLSGSSNFSFDYTNNRLILTGSLYVTNSIYLGNSSAPSLNTTIYTASITPGSYILYSFPTSSYDGFWFEYTVRSGSNARAGQMMGIWSGSDVHFTETTTTDFGTTTDISFMSTVLAGNMIISSSITTGGWTIKGIIRSI